MSRTKAMTLIAAKANVNPITVRRYLDGTTKAHAIVEEAILHAAKELKIDLKPLRKKAA
jgi:DNA-binding LacI/PurR family transcriptional regulator